MAAVSVLEALVIIGVGVAGFMVVPARDGRCVAAASRTRQVAPAMVRVNAILDDVKGVTAKVKEETERVDHGDPLDDGSRSTTPPTGCASNVRAKTSRSSAFVRGARVAVEDILRSRHQHVDGT